MMKKQITMLYNMDTPILLNRRLASVVTVVTSLLEKKDCF